VQPGSVLTLDIEKPVTGGRMLARHEGQVVLVWGAIPGERVRAEVDRVGSGVVYANTVEVLTASPDRREADPDWRCGGNVYAHITYPRQVALKGEIIQETFGRIGRVRMPSPPAVMASPEHGYRMRARFHVSDYRLGYFREGTHELCDPVKTRQLSERTHQWIADTGRQLRREGLDAVATIEISENIAGDERACHVELRDGVDPARAGTIACASSVGDVLHARDGDPATALRLRRTVRAFFQANRFLLEPMARYVISLVPPGPVVDLYAGVGLFGLLLAASGADDVTLVEGDRVSGADLQDNAEPFRDAVRVERTSVEAYVNGVGGHFSRTPAVPVTFIVDPPRTGMSKAALTGIIASRPARIIYVSCDVATLARDTRTILDAGYELGGVTGLDMFPNTAHVESVVTFSRSRP
jgi:23S rRNA (uracil1939-C5)-methyltransferase